MLFSVFVFFMQSTGYGVRSSDWSSDVCSSDLGGVWMPWIAMTSSCALVAVRVERSRDTHQSSARPMGVSTALDTNGTNQKHQLSCTVSTAFTRPPLRATTASSGACCDRRPDTKPLL